jgi:hypothetical protein
MIMDGDGWTWTYAARRGQREVDRVTEVHDWVADGAIVLPAWADAHQNCDARQSTEEPEDVLEAEEESGDD